MNRDRRFEDLWAEAADDGASTPVGASGFASGAELEELCDAWLEERTQRIEGLLVLDQARRLIARMLAEGEISARSRKRAIGIVRAIRNIQAQGR